jgi:RNase P subunit RPR2
MVEAYCVKCKAKRIMEKPQQVKLKNGKPATKGICPKCGTKMFRIGG